MRKGTQHKSLHNISSLGGDEAYTRMKILADENGVKMSKFVGQIIDREWKQFLRKLKETNPDRLRALAIVYGFEELLETYKDTSNEESERGTISVPTP